MSEYSFAVWGTQGGGLVRLNFGRYVFVEVPEGFGFSIGQAVPAEWDLAPANERARQHECADEDHANQAAEFID